jgi:addiction module HigA family antidote
MPRKKLPPITPGEILLEEFLKPIEVSQNQLAKDVGVPPRLINKIVLGKSVVTGGTALRLARYFGTSDRFWLNLQAQHDLETEKDRLGARLRK